MPIGKPPFPPLPEESWRTLCAYDKVIQRGAPLPPRHRGGLPRHVRDLSRALTSQRGKSFATDYMGRPAELAAYVHYFLPWNLIRLGRLFGGLDLNLEEGSTILDLGAGPLTAVQAMWLARPDLRGKRLRWLCLDRAGKSLKTGADLFRALAGDTPWKIETVQAPFARPPRVKANLVMAANTLNELTRQKGGKAASPVEQAVQSLRRPLAKGGRLLLVEPGTRQAVQGLTSLRTALIESGLYPSSPCPHTVECPMPGEHGKPWCHFTFTQNPPPFLASLGKAAGLGKEEAALSYLFLGEEVPERTDLARVVSQSISTTSGQARYACTERGLTLVRLGRTDAPSGSLIRVHWPSGGHKDPKSGALLADPVSD
ncbi:small ribosomal subunit Rsm22 family protein [Desulfohalovibrio reitneri]|uniref:small ribosomal subunit Rsm22 family protein n=1 Tax=Desulfohalovibrio reitneri TaxID=1307759 RepID=UPI00068F1D05|nr:small ribosomal subunit Rsm22 family protein [Desulfohalovibrio reitneri]